MIKLLVIADDLTGALDTGVQLKAKNTQILLARYEEKSLLRNMRENCQVLIINGETRHMTPKNAYEAVNRIVTEAIASGIHYIYKKTDSGLRGNIGSELSGMLDASQEKQLHFIPAFPKINRITVGGIHYIDGVPVADSVFGSDLFEPVRHSLIKDIIAEQSNIQTKLITTEEMRTDEKGIIIYEASSDEDLHCIGRMLKNSGRLSLMAGCAGFASVLPELLELQLDNAISPVFLPRLITISGSINPITIEQLNLAENTGMPRVSLTTDQKLDKNWLDSSDGKETIQKLLKQIESHGSLIIDCYEEGDKIEQYARKHSLSTEQLRVQISTAMGSVLKSLLDRGLDATLLVTGGDTLLAFLMQIEQEEITLLGELMPGIVLSQIRYNNRNFNLISKSGGFGSPTLLLDLEERILNLEEKRRN